MNTDFYDMEQPDEFPGIGKKLPYREPVDFFEELSKKTLEVAKQRSRTRTRLIIWRSVAVAASLAAVVFLGFLVQDKETAHRIAVVEQKTVETPVIKEEQQLVLEKPVVADVKNEQTEEGASMAVSDENVNDVLADLSDEELMELAAMFKADSFIEEVTQ